MDTIITIVLSVLLFFVFLVITIWLSFLRPADEDVCVTKIESYEHFWYVNRECQTELEFTHIKPTQDRCPFCKRVVAYKDVS